MKAQTNCQIYIEPQQETLTAYNGDSLYTLLLVNGIIGEGEEKCRLEKGSISVAINPTAEEAVFSTYELADGWMLASERNIDGDAHIFIPDQKAPLSPKPEKIIPKPEGLALVVDLGAGTIVAGLIDNQSLSIPAISARSNSQCDILGDMGARLKYIKERTNGVNELKDLLYHDLEQLILRLKMKSGLDPATINTIIIAANTALGQILWGEMPTINRQDKQDKTWQKLRKKEIGQTPLKSLIPQANIFLLSGAAMDIGADTIAAILAAGLEQKIEQDNLTLLLDIGLSTEIVLAGRGRILITSVATPALEGIGLSCGMRATTGAIERVVMDNFIALNTVRDAAPRGICGAGLISASYELLRHGLLDIDGRIVFHNQLPSHLANHFSRTLSGGDIVLSRGRNNPDIYIDQHDIRQLQLAKGSIYAAIQTLLAEFYATEKDLSQILIAESYGAHIDIEAAKNIGLIPDIATDKIKLIANAAWQGAYICLGNLHTMEAIENLAQQIEHLDLNINLTYAEQFLAAMNFEQPAKPNYRFWPFR